MMNQCQQTFGAFVKNPTWDSQADSDMELFRTFLHAAHKDGMKPESIIELIEIHCDDTRPNLTAGQKEVLISFFDAELKNTYQSLEKGKANQTIHSTPLTRRD
jgi:hypothetical protein